MATYPVKFEGSDEWAIRESCSETMFTPIFSEALAAHMFAAYYWLRYANLATDYTDGFQTTLAQSIRDFLDERMGPAHHQMREVPREWLLEADPVPDDWNTAEDGEWNPGFDCDDIVLMFEQGGRVRNSIVTTIMIELLEWRRAREPKPAEPVSGGSHASV